MSIISKHPVPEELTQNRMKALMVKEFPDIPALKIKQEIDVLFKKYNHAIEIDTSDSGETDHLGEHAKKQVNEAWNNLWFRIEMSRIVEDLLIENLRLRLTLGESQVTNR
jgi:hypothetical protein